MIPSIKNVRRKTTLTPPKSYKTKVSRNIGKLFELLEIKLFPKV